MRITNKLNLPTSFVDAVSREYQYKDKQYSVTSLLKGIRENILLRRYHDEIEVDVAEMIWLIFGSATHSILENAKTQEHEHKEQKLRIEVGDYKLSGIFDLYDAKQFKVVDYKTASVWKSMFKDYEDWKKQLLIYAYMLNENGMKCTKGEIIALYKDHKKNDVKDNYPPYPVEKFEFNFTDDDFIYIEDWIKSRFEEIKQAEQLDDHDLPLCTPEERWHRGDKWAIMKTGVKKAVRLFDTFTQATDYLEWNINDSNNYDVVFREGVSAKCLDYCSVRHICPFGKLVKEKYAKQKNESFSD